MSDVKIEKLVLGDLQTNTYIVYKNGRGFIVDATGDAKILDGEIARLGIDIEAVLLTHGHFDHCLLAKHYREKGIKLYIHGCESEKLFTKKNLALLCGICFPYTEADVLVNDGDVFSIADISVEVLHTPGHSEGSVCYVVDEANAIFVGDLIFKLSYGRTDFYDGDFNKMIKSIKKLFALEKNYTLYTGHGDITTLDYEKRNNPIKFEAAEIL